MDKIDQISNMLGAMAANIENISQKQDENGDKLDKINEKTIEHSVTIKAAHRRLDKIEPQVVDHEGLKNKGLGIIGFVSFLFGILGAYIGKLLHFAG